MSSYIEFVYNKKCQGANIDWLSFLLSAISLMCVPTSHFLFVCLTCVTHVSHHGRLYWICFVLRTTGMVDNLSSAAMGLDDAEVSSGLWTRSVGCWFITWHAPRMSWCISKKFTEKSLKFKWVAGFQTQTHDAWLCSVQSLCSHLSSDFIDSCFDRF